MRPRLVAVFVLLTAVLGSLLTGASAAHAQGPSDPVCRMTLLGTLEVICTIPVEAENKGTIDFIQWTKNGKDLTGAEFDGVRSILLSCKAGETFVIGVTVGVDPDDPAEPPGMIEGSTQFTCRSEPLRISQAACDREQTGPGWVCTATWTGGVGQATASWSVYVGRPSPYVETNAAARVTVAHFACFFNEAEPDYQVRLTVRDAGGAEVHFYSYVCQW